MLQYYHLPTCEHSLDTTKTVCGYDIDFETTTSSSDGRGPRPIHERLTDNINTLTLLTLTYIHRQHITATTILASGAADTYCYMVLFDGILSHEYWLVRGAVRHDSSWIVQE
jgi:hypothetical protein